MKFCSECGAKVILSPARVEPNSSERQIQLFPIKRYQNENVTDSVTQQDIDIQDNVRSNQIGQEICEEGNAQVINEITEEVVEGEKTNISEEQEDVTLISTEDVDYEKEVLQEETSIDSVDDVEMVSEKNIISEDVSDDTDENSVEVLHSEIQKTDI